MRKNQLILFFKIIIRPYGIDYPKEKWWKINEDLMLECNGRPHWAKV